MATIKELANILGIFQKPPAQAGGSQNDEILAKVMPLVIDLRGEARAAKNFATADAIRDGLAAAGIKIEDRPGGAEWTGGGDGALDRVMQLLISLRQTARQNKDFKTSDAIRDRLALIGIKMEDRAGGIEWSRG
jgi:cysteinyl-tRNA synthetase